MHACFGSGFEHSSEGVNRFLQFRDLTRKQFTEFTKGFGIQPNAFVFHFDQRRDQPGFDPVKDLFLLLLLELRF